MTNTTKTITQEELNKIQAGYSPSEVAIDSGPVGSDAFYNALKRIEEALQPTISNNSP